MTVIISFKQKKGDVYKRQRYSLVPLSRMTSITRILISFVPFFSSPGRTVITVSYTHLLQIQEWFKAVVAKDDDTMKLLSRAILDKDEKQIARQLNICLLYTSSRQVAREKQP